MCRGLGCKSSAERGESNTVQLWINRFFHLSLFCIEIGENKRQSAPFCGFGLFWQKASEWQSLSSGRGWGWRREKTETETQRLQVCADVILLCSKFSGESCLYLLINHVFSVCVCVFVRGLCHFNIKCWWWGKMTKKRAQKLMMRWSTDAECTCFN